VSSSRRILIADGCAAGTALIKAYLTEVGYDVEVALDGQDALDKARSYLPDLILLDAMIPGFSSFDVCRTLKDDFQLSKIMVLMITPLNELEAIERSIEAGTDDFLSKPLGTRELLERIEKVLRLSDLVGE
jgi:DNA-binding response OmpR family regulator